MEIQANCQLISLLNQCRQIIVKREGAGEDFQPGY